MESMRNKRIIFVSLVILFMGSLITTNADLLRTDTHQCQVKDIHINPCAIANFGEVSFSLEQEISVELSLTQVPTIEGSYILFLENKIISSRDNYFYYYPNNSGPPTHKQLARSHI